MPRHTLIFKNALENLEALSQAANIIRAGGLVVMPTETVYGLGANAMDDAAVRSIFSAKGRPQDNPLIAHVADIADVGVLAASIPSLAAYLFSRFSPGPLTIVLQKKPEVPDSVCAGLATVAIRIPEHPLARALIRAAGVPIVAPSANISGRPSPTSFTMALADMDGRADAILDGGDCKHGLESTVIAVEGDTLRILRPGAVTSEMLREALLESDLFKACLILDATSEENHKPSSPGMKYAHYQPKAQVYIAQRIDQDSITDIFPHKKVGLIVLGDGSSQGRLEKTAPPYPDGSLALRVASRTEYARLLYRCFHLMDEAGVDVIVAQEAEQGGIGTALMNRLRKASSGRKI